MLCVRCQHCGLTGFSVAQWSSVAQWFSVDHCTGCHAGLPRAVDRLDRSGIRRV